VDSKIGVSQQEREHGWIRVCVFFVEWDFASPGSSSRAKEARRMGGIGVTTVICHVMHCLLFVGLALTSLCVALSYREGTLPPK